jgi:hypothetical protein
MSALDNRDVIYIPPTELVIHEKLIEIYGEKENRPKLETSIREEGIITPLEVSSRTGQKVVLSGKCRLQIAKKLGLATVPIKIGNYLSPQQELNAVFSLNITRGDKTNFQKLAEGKSWESVFRPQAKERQQEGASYARTCLLSSNLTEAEDETHLQEKRRVDVRAAVANKLQISTGSYSKGKKVFELISQLQHSGKLYAADALLRELNRSIHAAYKFISCPQRDEVLDVIEKGEVNSIRDGLGLVRTSFRNPFRGFAIGQVYQFRERLRPEFEICGRVIKITNEFIEFGFRSLSSMSLETVNLRPQQVDAFLVEEPSMEERKRIFRLLQKPNLIYPMRLAVTEMLKFPHLTMEEEAFLRLLEGGKLEEMIEQRRIELEMLSRNENTGVLVLLR